jgi:hypothetical protein
MDLEQHLGMDIVRGFEQQARIHALLDSTDTTIGHPHRQDTHYLEWLLDCLKDGKITIQEFRSGIHHIIDDCGVLMLKEDWG